MSDYNSTQACPSPTVLAAFVEGTLDPHTNTRVALHVADCVECVQIAGATARFLAEEQNENGRDADLHATRRHWWVAAAIALAATSMIAAFGWYVTSSRDPMRRLRSLAREEGVRRIEGRLDRFPYGRLVLKRSVSPGVSLAYRAELERLKRAPSKDAEAAHALGVARLVNGESKDAVLRLLAATRLDARDAAAWSDLAAAQIEQRSYADALSAADRAIELAPERVSAHFNRALALARLGRYGEASDAYRTALRFETDPHWQAEIRQRLSELPR